MKEFIKLLEPVLKNLGMPVDFILEGEVSYLVLLCLYYFIMSTFVLLNVLNISMYLLSIYIVSDERFLSKIPAKYVRIHKLIKFYKNIRIAYIVYEVILMLICLIIMISISYGLVYFFLSEINN